MQFKYEVDADINLVFLHEFLADDIYKLVNANRNYLMQWIISQEILKLIIINI